LDAAAVSNKSGSNKKEKEASWSNCKSSSIYSNMTRVKSAAQPSLELNALQHRRCGPMHDKLQRPIAEAATDRPSVPTGFAFGHKLLFRQTQAALNLSFAATAFPRRPVFCEFFLLHVVRDPELEAIDTADLAAKVPKRWFHASPAFGMVPITVD